MSSLEGIYRGYQDIFSLHSIAVQATRISVVDLAPAANGSRQGADLFVLGRRR